MKTILAFTLALLCAGAAFAADALPTFNATLTSGGQNRFLLIGFDGKASSWLKLGDTFAGYKLNSFDAKTNTLEIEHDGATAHITLAADAKVAEGALAATPATLADAQDVLNKMHFENMMKRVMDQQKVMVGKMLQQMSSRMNIPAEHRDDFVAFQQRVMDEMMSAMNVDQMKADTEKIYSEVFTKEELAGLGAFYETPTGEAMTSKLPIVQQKMQEAMMPRMMAMMPKIQQMSQEFAAQEKAKMQAEAAAKAAPAVPAEPAPAPAAK